MPASIPCPPGTAAVTVMTGSSPWRRRLFRGLRRATRAVAAAPEHGEVCAVQPETALVAQPALELVGKPGRRLHHRAAVVADDVHVIVLGRPEGRGAVVEMGMPHH